MIEGDDVKLIDMGAVRKIGDPDGAIFATSGYMAPEAEQDPDAVSDLYTVGRTLANLVMEMRMTGSYEYAIPSANEQPVLGKHESLRLFLERCCARDPALRFQAAEEAADQLFGVLREVVALESGEAKPGVSRCFLGDGLLEPDPAAIARPSSASLPRMRPDADDPAAGALMAAATLAGDAKLAQVRNIRAQFPRSGEAPVAEIETLIILGETGQAKTQAQALLAKDPYDWKAWFLEGHAAFREGDYRTAGERFARIRAELPGESAAQLALALALEAIGETAAAEPLYDRVSRADPAYVSAAFGLARCRLTAGNRAGAAEALERAPSGHALYPSARLEAARILSVRTPSAGAPTVEHLARASAAVVALSLDSKDARLLEADILLEAARQIETGAAQPADERLFDRPMQSRDLRLGAEAALRSAARAVEDRGARYALVDRANSVRPRTWW
jgi:serine/threonine-protein kinase PknG